MTLYGSVIGTRMDYITKIIKINIGWRKKEPSAGTLSFIWEAAIFLVVSSDAKYLMKSFFQNSPTHFWRFVQSKHFFYYETEFKNLCCFIVMQLYLCICINYVFVIFPAPFCCFKSFSLSQSSLGSEHNHLHLVFDFQGASGWESL